MAKPQARTNQIPIPQLKQEETQVGGSEDFLAGFINDSDPAQIPPNALVVADNVAYIRNMLFRRNGLQPYSLTKPNSSKVLNIYAANQVGSGLNIYRFDQSKIYVARSTGFVEITPNIIAANSGGLTDYFSFTAGDNRTFFCNGVDPIREIDPVALQYKQLGNAPVYKYITMAFNRLIGANRVDTTNVPYEIGWSGLMNYGEYDPTVDLSAGLTPLVDSPSDTSDDLTGISSYGNTLIACREKSMWLGSFTRSSTNPFSFYSALPKLGADTPRTIQLTDDFGLVWFNSSKNDVYVWSIPTNSYQNNAPEAISATTVRRYLKQQFSTASEVWGAYSQDNKTYSLYFKYSNSSTVSVATFNFITKTWNTEEFNNSPSCTTDLDFSASTITINDLQGTINALLGTINSLGGLVANSTRFYGFDNGDIDTSPFYSGMASEVGNISLTDNGTSFTTEIRSKIFEIPIYDTIINLVRFAYTPYTTGTINLEYSKDDGNTWTTMKTVTVQSTQLNKAQLLQIRRARKARRFQWRITTSNCMFALNGFNIRAVTAGVSK